LEQDPAGSSSGTPNEGAQLTREALDQLKADAFEKTRAWVDAELASGTSPALLIAELAGMFSE
jgi:hypothetical protein